MSKIFGKKFHHYEVIDSTNAEAIRRAKQGGEEGEVFIADQQTAGRGRLGRSWESPAGKNLYLSFILKPKILPSQAPVLTLVAGAAAFDTLIDLLPDRLKSTLKIKRPNDLYLQDKKVGGILAEMDTRENRLNWVVCGIGINVNSDPTDFSPEVRKIATSLKMVAGEQWDLKKLAAKLIDSFEKRYSQFLKEGPQETLAFCERNSYLVTLCEGDS